MNDARTLPRGGWCAAVAATLLSFGTPSWAAAEAGAAERAAIAGERDAVEAAFVARGAECRSRFVVSSCLEEARNKRREALDALRTRQLVVDEARRREHAETRRVDLAARSASDTAREQERVAKAMQAASSSSATSAPREARLPSARREGSPGFTHAASRPRERSGASSASSASAAAKPPARENTARRRAGEVDKSAAFETRKREAAQHRDDVLDATTRRMLQRSPAPSLPTPSAPVRRGASAP